MFCSKCGNKLSADSVFCEQCGHKAIADEGKVVERVYVYEKTSSPTDKMTEKERNLKLLSLVTFAIYAASCLLFVICLYSDNVIAMFSNGYSYAVSYASEQLTQKYALLVIAFQIVTIVLETVFTYILPYKSRKYVEMKKISAIFQSASVIAVVFTLAIVYGVCSEYSLSLGVMFWLAVIYFAAMEICKCVIYGLAVREEEKSKYYENNPRSEKLLRLNPTETEWICACGGKNPSTQDYCKECGEYR